MIVVDGSGLQPMVVTSNDIAANNRAAVWDEVGFDTFAPRKGESECCSDIVQRDVVSCLISATIG